MKKYSKYKILLINVGKYFIYPKILLKTRNFFSTLMWEASIRDFKHVGEDSRVGKGFSVQGPENISIGDGFCAGDNVSLETWLVNKISSSPEIIIGDNVSITKNGYISCSNKIVIGDGTLLGVNTFITDNFHGKNTFEEVGIAPNNRIIYSKGPVVLGKNIWTGRNVCIMPGVTIGDGAIIGANSVVTHDIPSCCIVAGSPAKIVKRLVSTMEGETVEN